MKVEKSYCIECDQPIAFCECQKRCNLCQWYNFNAQWCNKHYAKKKYLEKCDDFISIKEGENV